jgi:hypothetical protein
MNDTIEAAKQLLMSKMLCKNFSQKHQDLVDTTHIMGTHYSPANISELMSLSNLDADIIAAGDNSAEIKQRSNRW